MSTSKYMVIGGQVQQLPQAFDLPAEAICLDLEDTVSATLKDRARAALPHLVALAARTGKTAAVRINALSTFEGLRDLLLLQQLEHAPAMIVLAKTESARDVVLVRDLLQPLHGPLHLQPIIETTAALHQVEDIAGVFGVGSLSLGGKDLSESLRVERGWEPLLYARSRCSAAAAMHGIPIVDGPQSRDESSESLRALCVKLKALGFAGKSAVFPEHLPVINEVWDK